MLLLYCTNGVVTATHDDTQAPVSLSNYPGARIIPYDQPLDTLTKIGSPPAPPSDPISWPQPDMRPYAQPTETPHILTMYASQVRFNYIAAGFTFNAASGPIPVDSSRNSWMLIGNLAQHAASLTPSAAIDFTQGHVHYPITAQEAINLFSQFSTFQQKYRTVEAQCITDLNSATPTIKVYADVDAKFAAA